MTALQSLLGCVYVPFLSSNHFHSNSWRSGTTQIYQQLLSLENVLPSTATESDGKKMSSLCDGRPTVWCEKESLVVIEMFKQPVSWWKMGV